MYFFSSALRGSGMWETGKRPVTRALLAPWPKKLPATRDDGMSRSRMSRSRLAKISHYYFGLFHDSVHKTRTINDHFALTRARAGRRRRTLAVHRRDSAQGHGHHQWPCPGHVSEIRRPSSQTGEQARAPTQCYGVDGADQAARKPGAHHRYHGRVASWQGCLCCVWPFARPDCDHHHCTR